MGTRTHPSGNSQTPARRADQLDLHPIRPRAGLVDANSRGHRTEPIGRIETRHWVALTHDRRTGLRGDTLPSLVEPKNDKSSVGVRRAVLEGLGYGEWSTPLLREIVPRLMTSRIRLRVRR